MYTDGYACIICIRLETNFLTTELIVTLKKSNLKFNCKGKPHVFKGETTFIPSCLFPWQTKLFTDRVWENSWKPTPTEKEGRTEKARDPSTESLSIHLYIFQWVSTNCWNVSMLTQHFKCYFNIISPLEIRHAIT